MTKLSFPGLGIGEFELDPVAIRIGDSFEIRWYGIIIVTGIILAFLYACYRAKHEGISFDHMIDITLFTVVFAVIGARAYYVLTSLDQYDSFLDMIAIWNGGLAIYGGIIAGAITIFVVCKIKKLSFVKVLDLAAPAVMIGQIIGRWGNFFNGEAYGGVVYEGSPLYFLRMGISPHNIEGIKGMAYVHPTFFYESMWNLVGFALIHFLYKKKKFDGQIVLMYLTWYGFGRMLIEGLRTDSLYVGVFRISQVVGFLCFVGGSVALIFNLARAYRKKKDGEEYAPSYKKMSKPGAIFESAEAVAEDESETAQTPETDEPKDADEETDDLLQKYMDEEAKSFEEEKKNGEDN